jgi:uncharacterized membrane protein (UPF0127 family)
MLYIDIARTPEHRQQGLMFVEDLDPDSGMLFEFQNVQPLSFWNMNTLIPLDLAFVDENKTIRKIDYLPSVQDSMRVISKGFQNPCKWVIEANYNYFADKNVKEGDKIYIHEEDNNKPFIVFIKEYKKDYNELV